MASLSVISDTTKPIDTRKWPPTRKQTPLTKEQRNALETIQDFGVSQATKVPAEMDIDLDTALQESMPWKEIHRKKDTTTTTETDKVKAMQKNVNGMEQDSQDIGMKKVKVTFAIRVPKDTENFSPAKLHIDALHEIHKFD
jgi:hypothetical protein